MSKPTQGSNQPVVECVRRRRSSFSGYSYRVWGWPFISILWRSWEWSELCLISHCMPLYRVRNKYNMCN